MFYNTNGADFQMNSTYFVTVGFADNSTHNLEVTAQFNPAFNQTILPASNTTLGFYNMSYLEFTPAAA